MVDLRASDISDGFVPSFLLAGEEETSEPLPLVVSIITLDENGEICPLPAVKHAIDRTVVATGKEGLLQAKITNRTRLEELVPFYVEKARECRNAILLMQCLNAELAEGVMQYLGRKYRLALIPFT